MTRAIAAGAVFVRVAEAASALATSPAPKRIYAALGIFDTPDAFPAGFHDNRQSSIAWLRLDEHLPDAADFKPQPRRG
jgi:hypothetical protein